MYYLNVCQVSYYLSRDLNEKMVVHIGLQGMMEFPNNHNIFYNSLQFVSLINDFIV